MSMTTVVEGIKPPDAKFEKMYKVWEACEDVGVETPKEVEDFFDGEMPDPKGVIVEQKKLGKAVKIYRTEGDDGFEIELDKLPKDIKIIRFFNSY